MNLKDQEQKTTVMNEKCEGLRSYIWEYFKLHADQRIQAFHFFVTLQTAFMAGLFLIITTQNKLNKYSAILGFVMSLLSFVFWKLDHRTKMLIKMSERSLQFIEDQNDFPDIEGKPHFLRLMARSEAELRDTKSTPLASGTLTYSKCFGIVFLTFGVLGLTYVVWAICLSS